MRQPEITIGITPFFKPPRPRRKGTKNTRELRKNHDISMLRKSNNKVNIGIDST